MSKPTWERDSMALLVANKLKDTLASVGFTKMSKATLRGTPFCVTFSNLDPEVCLLGDPAHCPKVELYESDAFPNPKDEIFLHVWNCIGMSYKGRDLAVTLVAAGFPARVTTYRKDTGLRVKMPDLYKEFFGH
jgi:hypothetical protein